MPAESGRRSGVNVVARLRGEAGVAGACVIVGAHYDTRPNSPGADDNASGVAAMVECVRALGGRRLRCDVIFVAFDAEERQGQLHGLWGSGAFVRSLTGTARGDVAPRLARGERPDPSPQHPASPGTRPPSGEGENVATRPFEGLWNRGERESTDAPKVSRLVRAALVLEMVGFSSLKGTQKIPIGMRALFPSAGWSVIRRGYAGDFLVAVTRGRGKKVARALAKHSRRTGGPDVLTLGLPGWLPPPPDLLRSDHAPFWLAGVPAVMVGDTANFRNPNYHLPSDTPETLDYGMVAGVARALAETVAELASER